MKLRHIRKTATAASLGTALMASGIVKGEVPELSIETGIGVKMPETQARARLIIGAKLRIGRFSIGSRFGVSNSGEEVQLEEVDTSITAKVAGPLSLKAYGSNSRHMAITGYSVGGDLILDLPFGTTVLGSKYVFDKGLSPIYFGIRVPISSFLSGLVSGGYIPQKEIGIIRAVLDLKVDEHLGIGMDSFTMVKSSGLVFSDLTSGLRWRW